MAERGHEVFLVAANPGTDVEGNIPFQYHFFQPFKKKFLGKDLRLILNDLLLRRELSRIIKTFSPHIIYERYSLYFRAGESIARRLNIPRIVEINSPLSLEQKARLRLPWLARNIENHIFRNCDFAIVVSEVIKNYLLSLGVEKERIIVQPIAVDPVFLSSDCGEPPAELRRRCEGKLVIGYIGTLLHYHRINIIFEIARDLINFNKEIVFLMIGGEKQKVDKYRLRAQKQQMGEYFIFTGSVPYKTIPRYLKLIDIGIIPNTAPWASPTKMFEYAAMRKPIVAPDYLPIRSFLPPETHWVLFPPNDGNALKERIMKLARHPELRKQIGEMNRQCVLEKYTWQHYIDRIEKIATESIRSKNTPRVI